tara:strand:- start:29581 stop:30195 length:615 start_codon:yes stop_codon:yes gene_type:complete
MAESKMDAHLEFYKHSLNLADQEVEYQVTVVGKALKDVVGAAYENHRRRIWQYFGFTVSKERFGAMFDVDWSVSYNGKLCAFEEDKGHYLDSCQAGRAIMGFAKTADVYIKEGKPIPKCIISTFTRYKKYDEKLKEFWIITKPEIVNELKKKLVYNTLVSRDRIPPKSWFNIRENRFNCYVSNVEDELIIKDIEFIQSLIPDSQ